MKRTISKILTPVDFSDGSRMSLEYSFFLAETFDAVIEILHVLEPITYSPAEPWLSAHHPDHQGLETKAHAEAEKGLARILDNLKAHQRKRVFSYIAKGKPYERIVETAVQDKVSLIVVCTHGRTGLKRVLLGSVTEMVVRHAPCPVLVVPHQKK